MMREMESEFSDDEEEQNIAGPEMYGTRSQSLSADFNRLSIGSSSSSSALIHGLSKSSRHTVISGDHVEVDNNTYQSDFNSHKRGNNIIKNSFRK